MRVDKIQKFGGNKTFGNKGNILKKGNILNMTIGSTSKGYGQNKYDTSKNQHFGVSNKIGRDHVMRRSGITLSGKNGTKSLRKLAYGNGNRI